MRSIFKSNLFFFIPYALFLIAGGIVISINSKADIHLEFNKFHTDFFDVFFHYFTHMGDGLPVVLLTVMLLAIRYRYAVIVGLTNVAAAIITQTLKHTIYSDVVRPKLFFENVHDLYLVPGVDNHLHNSFPSGHSTCAFSLYLSLALILKTKRWKLLCFFMAISVGYSRIYLSQHFLEDIYAGSIIGVTTTFVLFYFIQRSDKQWLDSSLVKTFRD